MLKTVELLNIFVETMIKMDERFDMAHPNFTFNYNFNRKYISTGQLSLSKHVKWV